MDIVDDVLPSPGLIVSTPLTTTLGMDRTPLNDNSRNDSPGHQGVKSSGGTDKNLRVLFCSNVDLSLDYHCLYQVVKGYGEVERMKMALSKDKGSFNSYITYSTNTFASKACDSLKGHSINGSAIDTKLISRSNLLDDPFDYIPERCDNTNAKTARETPLLVWHVATYKEGKENLIKAAECIQSRVGNIPDGNMKRYGRSVLIKAGNEVQRALLSKFKPPLEGNIQAISPHKSFNIHKAVIYSKDLYEFSEEEILDRCPTGVYEVRKLKGSNNAILLSFTSPSIPDVITVNHVRIKVKKYRFNPKQCRNCFEYGHIASVCKVDTRCHVCSGVHEDLETCSLQRFCFLCEGNHSPNSRQCPRYCFEQEIIEVAHNEHISIGSAKRKIMGANKHPQATYASVAKEITRSKSSNQISKVKTTSSKPPMPDMPCASQNIQGIPSLNERNPPESKPSDVGRGTGDNSVQSSEDHPNLTNSQSAGENPKSVILETQSSNVTLPKMGIDEDGFSVPTGKKRSRPESPKKSDFDIEKSNSFSLLDNNLEEKLSKTRKVNSVESIPTAAQHGSHMGERHPRDQKQKSSVNKSCSQVRESSSVRANVKSEPKAASHTSSTKPSNAGAPVRSKHGKENFNHSSTEKSPQCKDKAGKKTR